MVEAFVRTETKSYVRILVVEFQDGRIAKFWGGSSEGSSLTLIVQKPGRQVMDSRQGFGS